MIAGPQEKPAREQATADMFKLGMRRLAAGVSLVTTVSDGAPAGVIATSVTAVSAVPASLLVCVNRDASAHDAIDKAGFFCVNLLGNGEEEKELVSQFSSTSRRADRFNTGEWERTGTGALTLASAIASFDCIVETSLRHHSHTIFIGRLEEVKIGTERQPLIYFDRGYFC